MNRYEELVITLSSLKRQDSDFELIVVDNGSENESSKKVREIWPEAKIIKLKLNQGVSGGRNRGIEAATGEIIVFLDDDASFASRNALSRIRKRFEEDPDLGILAANSYLTATGKPEIAAIPRRDKKVIDTDYQASYFCGVGFALRRDLIEKIGLFFERFFYSCEELDLSWRTIESGYRIMWAADIVVLHRCSPVVRTRGRWVHSNARNRVWLAVRHLPWRYVLSYTVLWWGFLFVKSIRDLLIKDFLKGIYDCLAGLPEILRGRRLLSKTALETIRNNNGRLIY